MKKVKLNNNKVVDIVMETLKRDGVFVTKSKIDKVINSYLVEREEILLDDELPIDDTFSDESKLAFDDMVIGVSGMIEDLSIIQVKEPGIDVGGIDLYSEDYIESIITDLENILEKLEYIKDL